LALWPWVQPAVYFFFFPALFFAAWLGGRRAAVPASLISSLLVLYFFLPPRFSWNFHPGSIATTMLFVAMGYLFGDVYDRLNRQSQLALAASEEKYQLLFETLQEGVAYCEIILDEEQRPVDWRYLEVNPAYSHLTGIHHMVGRLASEALPSILEANPNLLDNLGRVAALQEPADFDECLPLSPEPRWLHISATSPSAGRFVMALADITDRRLAEQDLAAAELRYRTLFESLIEGVAYCEMFFDDRGDPVDWIYLDVNEAFARITGLQGIKGKRVSEALPGLRESNPEVFEIYGAVARSGEPAEFETYVPVLPQGQWLHISVSCPSEGHFVAAFADITERKNAEEALRNLNVVLEERVEQRTAEVTATNTELEAFAYAVSHDLRAPLRAMSGFSQALVEDCADELDAQGREYLQRIIAASRSMGELIDALLLLSRTTRGDMARDSIDISAMATSLLDERRAGRPERVVEASVEPGLTTFGDLRMVESLMRNLIGNAWKYSKNREVAHIAVASAEIDGERWICVSDDGAGFDPAYSDQLFKPFRRLHRQDEFAGIGIGLATVQRVVARHGGEIRAEGEADRGAKFCFRLPEPAEKA